MSPDIYIFVTLVIIAFAIVMGTTVHNRKHPELDLKGRDRYNFVIIIVITIVLVLAAVAYNSNQQRLNNHKFCQVVTGFTANKVTKPADPAKEPGQEQNYEWYVRFVNLGKSLGC